VSGEFHATGEINVQHFNRVAEIRADAYSSTINKKCVKIAYSVQGPGFRVQGSGFKVQGSGCRVQGACFLEFNHQQEVRTLSEESRVQGLFVRAWDSWNTTAASPKPVPRPTHWPSTA